MHSPSMADEPTSDSPVESGESIPVVRVDILRRLVYAKDLRTLAGNLDSRATDQSRGQAIVLLDASLESVLGTIVDSRPRQEPARPPNREVHFGSLLTSADRAFKPDSLFREGGIDEARLLRIHDLRNQIQHRAFLPSLEQLREVESVVDSNLRSIVQLAFGLGWDDISIALLLEEDLVKQLFVRGEAAWAKTQYRTAAIHFVGAFEVGRFLSSTGSGGA